MPNKPENFDEAAVVKALATLATIPFFPREAAERAAVGTMLRRMCPHREALTWTVETAANLWGEWKGIAQLRALLCTRFDPLDGVNNYFACETPGYTTAESEMHHFEQHQAMKSLPAPNIAQTLDLPPIEAKSLPKAKAPILREHKRRPLTDWEREQLAQEAANA